VNRRRFLFGMAGLASTSGLLLPAETAMAWLQASSPVSSPNSSLGFRLVDVTGAA